MLWNTAAPPAQEAQALIEDLANGLRIIKQRSSIPGSN
jgi:hypothetical protein